MNALQRMANLLNLSMDGMHATVEDVSTAMTGQAVDLIYQKSVFQLELRGRCWYLARVGEDGELGAVVPIVGDDAAVAARVVQEVSQEQINVEA